jgi:hypothetical protein
MVGTYRSKERFGLVKIGEPPNANLSSHSFDQTPIATRVSELCDSHVDCSDRTAWAGCGSTDFRVRELPSLGNRDRELRR